MPPPPMEPPLPDPPPPRKIVSLHHASVCLGASIHVAPSHRQTVMGREGSMQTDYESEKKKKKKEKRKKKKEMRAGTCWQERSSAKK